MEPWIAGRVEDVEVLLRKLEDKAPVEVQRALNILPEAVKHMSGYRARVIAAALLYYVSNGKLRQAWLAKELGVKQLSEEPREVEVLYFVGCAGSFDDRYKRVSTAMVRLLQAAGVSFGILGTEEKCCGDSARRIGNEYLYYNLATENIETLKKYSFRRILTTCPHCYQVLKKEYPQLGGRFEVVHHSEYLLELLETGRLRPRQLLREALTYHDSCFLGRYNDLYREPRELLELLGAELREMERHGVRAFCCGAGGGRMWMEEHLGRRINEMRTDQALEVGVNLIATACPFCLTMFEDGLKAREAEERVRVRDLAELLWEALQREGGSRA